MALLVPNFLTKNLKRWFVSYFKKILQEVVTLTSRIKENAQKEKNRDWAHHGSWRLAGIRIRGDRISGVSNFFLIPV
jgi:hypothetical protein